MSPSTVVVWFRRDLRLADHPALAEAAENHDRVLALFVDDPRLMGPAGANRRWFLRGCLESLDSSIEGRLVVRRGPPAEVVPDVAGEVGAEAVYVTDDAGPYGTARDTEVRAALRRGSVDFLPVDTPYAVAPGSLRTGSGTPFKVFTPFSKAWRRHGWPDPLPVPAVSWIGGVRSDGLPERPGVTADLPEPGEAAAHRRLAGFLDGPIDGYHDDRDRPDRAGTSGLSPYLRWGCIHPRQVLDRLGPGDGPATFAKELCWRDFYADVLLHRPDSARESLNEAVAGIEIDRDDGALARFDSWREGRTGVPIVDAGMRQLLATGWMHNRVRMLTASYLVKDLHLDWRWGARHFMEHLVDGDLASNQHGWQWVAGTGTDAAPYFRVFNPDTQARRFDPQGQYVRRWVPELAGLSGADAHSPPVGPGSLFDADPVDYPEPLVDHATERDEALRRWKRATGREE